MRLNTFIFTLCVCVLHARAASIPSEKKVDDLANVDLDDVVVEPELIDQAPVKDVENNLRKTIVDIPVKVVEEPAVVDENSNDYVPKNDDNIIIKRLEIDLNNPGPPQRQEHETQNPENYGELEKALFGVKKSIIDTENVFNQGLKEVSNSFKTLFGANEDLPAIHQNLENLKHSFTDQIEKLNATIISNLKPDSIERDKASENKFKIAETHLENLRKNFNAGVDTLTEGVEVLTIIKEEDEAAKTKSIVNVEDESAKQEPDANPSSSEAPAQQGSSQATEAPASSNFIVQFLTNFQNGMSNVFSNFNSALQNNSTGNQQTPANNNGGNGGNAFINFFQGLNLPNIIQGQNPTVNQNPDQNQGAQPSGAQSDTAAPTPAPAQWGPQAFFQQVQNTWQNFINPQQNTQQNTQQDTPQPAQQPANNRPFQQAFQNIVQFIQRPGQPPVQQQPQQQQQQQQPAKPAPVQEATPQSSSAPSNEPGNAVPQADAIPAAPQQAQPAPQAAPAQQPQPAQNGPIQQFVQNNPIIKGIQSAVQRIQGTPNPETPRNEIKDEDKEDAEVKGKPGPNANQGDISSGSGGVEEKIEEEKEQNIIPKGNEEVLGQIKAEEEKIPLPSDKTE